MDLSIKNINNLLLRTKGNEEFEKAFSMTDIEVCIQMLHEISESGGMDAMLEALKGEDK